MFCCKLIGKQNTQVESGKVRLGEVNCGGGDDDDDSGVAGSVVVLFVMATQLQPVLVGGLGS